MRGHKLASYPDISHMTVLRKIVRIFENGFLKE